MFISDLSYLEVASADVVGGSRSRNGGGASFKYIYQDNYNVTYQEAKAYAKAYKGDAYAYAYNDNYTYQYNNVG